MSEQADRLEAKMGRLIMLLERAEQKESEAPALNFLVEKLQPLDSSVWPEWYRDLYNLPNFKKDLAECQQWLSEKIIIGARADETAAYIRGVWPGPKKTWKQPWAVFRNLVQRQAQGASHATSRSISGPNIRQDPEESEMEDRARAQQLAERRGNVPTLPGNEMGQPDGPS